jgi:hypothetical protein
MFGTQRLAVELLIFELAVQLLPIERSSLVVAVVVFHFNPAAMLVHQLLVAMEHLLRQAA